MAISKTKRVFLSTLSLMTLGVGGCIYSMTTPRWVEWDKQDPNLHGQTITFDFPTSYEQIDPIDYYGTDEVPHNKLLNMDNRSKKVGAHVYKPNITIGGNKAGITNNIAPRNELKIIKSFWIRKNWWEKGFASETRHLVLEDQYGRKSLLAYRYLKYSSRPDLEYTEFYGFQKNEIKLSE